jgi:uncharacterized membrane protein
MFKRRRARSAAPLLVLCCSVGVALAGGSGPPLYEMTELTGFTANNIAWAISDPTPHGPVVVGQSFSAFMVPTLSHRAVAWRPQISLHAVDLQTVAEAGSSSVNRAQDVSRDGKYIVGYSNAPSPRGHRWTFDVATGTATANQTLGVLPGDGGSEGVGVNSAGTVAGYSITPVGDTRPCYWPGVSTTAVALAAPSAGSIKLAREISEPPAEVIVGRNDMSTGPPFTRPIMWTKSGADYGAGQLLDLLAAGQTADAFGVTPDGTRVVGFAGNGSGFGRGVGWEVATAQVTDLGGLPGTPFNMVYDMNDDGVGVGHTQFSLETPRATIYWDGEVFNLNERVVNNPAIGSTLFLHVATGINGAGQIVGKFGSFAIEDPYTPIGSRAFLLTPVSRPCALPGDVDDDGDVDQSDLGALLAAYGCTGGTPTLPCPADLNDDGDTDQSDLGTLLAHYGRACP